MNKIAVMFDEIAKKYDRNNRVLSGGVDLYWRRKMASFVPKSDRLKLLDCATGTGDQLITLLKNAPSICDAVGIDIADEMLELAKRKLAPWAHKAKVRNASVTKIPYNDCSFDLTTISFGIRNVDDVPKCLREFHRVLTPGGRALILEFSLPKMVVIQKLYLLYLNRLLPTIGRWLSSHIEAYTYLAKTIQTFPHGEAFCTLMKEAGFSAVKAHPLTCGIATIYSGEKHGV